MNFNEGNNQNKKLNTSTIVTGILLAIVVFLFILVIIDETETSEENNSVIHTSSSPIVNTPTINTSKPTVVETPTASTTISPTEVSRPTETPSQDYTYGLPIPEKLPAVDVNYFNDAIFIGDSRMEDFGLFTGIAKQATFYAKAGLTINKLIEGDGSKLVTFKVDGEKLTLFEALAKKNNFKKAYVMMGYNELGWPSASGFKQYYTRLLNEIRKVNPDAIIYVYCVIPVGRNPKDADLTVENNTRIAEFNEVIREICKEGRFHYLNVQEVMIDSEGYLPDHASTDGIHPTTEYYKKWLEYTKSHTI